LHAERAIVADRQARIGAELLERLQFFRLEPRLIVDLGCGAAAGAAALRARFPRARVIAIDLAFDPLQQARRRQRFWRRFDCICADASALPLAAQSADLIFSNLMLQECQDLPALFGEAQRVLRQGGLLLFSSFGPDTLRGLRATWAGEAGRDGAGEFADMPRLGAAMANAGLAEPVMDRELETAWYASARALLQDLHVLGARHVPAEVRAGLGGTGGMRSMLAAYEELRTGAGLPASWEVIYGAAFAGHGRESTTGRAAAKHEFAVPLAGIGSRRREP
jgi:malonyl-CoA O-methyltransferase